MSKKTVRYELGDSVLFVHNGERGVGFLVGFYKTEKLWRSGVQIKKQWHEPGYVHEEITHVLIEVEYTDLFGNSKVTEVKTEYRNLEDKISG